MWRCACAVALLCAALADADPFKRAEMSPSPFVLISRYGRSSPRMLSTRNDRFFLTGRYGKRSGTGFETERIALKIIENASLSNRERQRQRSIERDRDRNRRPKYYSSYPMSIPLSRYYQRSYADPLDTYDDK